MNIRHVIGIAGGSGAGKSFFAAQLRRRLGREKTLFLSQDYYYIGKTEEDVINRNEVNFDHPDAIDFKWFIKNIRELGAGKPTQRPVYSMKRQARLGRTVSLSPREFLIIEGTLIFVPQEIRNACSVKIYLDIPEKIRMDRRIARDLKERGRSIYDVMGQFRKFVLPMHREYVEPEAKWAALVFKESIVNEEVFSRIQRLDSNLQINNGGNADKGFC